MLRALLDGTPLWISLLATITLVLVAIELGFRIGGYRKGKRDKEGDSQVVSMTGARGGQTWGRGYCQSHQGLRSHTW